MAAGGDFQGECLMDEDFVYSEEDDDLSGEWNEVNVESESHIQCLFCTRTFITMAVALEHCKIDHKFNLKDLKTRFKMDCYSYICLINYLRKEAISAGSIMSCKDPPWVKDTYLVPVIQDDPWLMFDFEGLESPQESGDITPESDNHIVHSKNGVVTLTEQHFAHMQYTIKMLATQVREKEEALAMAADQIEQMKTITQNLVCSDPVTEEKSLRETVSKLKLADDAGYFRTYSHFGIHHEMLGDKARTTSYRDSFLNNMPDVHNKTVLDVGCGTGILSMFAAKAGAAKVIGIDQSDIVYQAMDIIRENNLTDKIELIRGTVENAVLPVSEVDILVSEWMGYFLLFEGMLDSVISARDKYLKKGGLMLPSRCTINIIGVADPENYQEMHGFWSDVYGFKMSCLSREVFKEAIVSVVPQSSVATEPACVLQLDLYTCDIPSTTFSSDFVLQSRIDGTLTALAGYFDTFFDLPNPVVLSTSPETQPTHWKQTIFYLPTPINVRKGETIPGHITCSRPKEDDRALVMTITISGQRNTYEMA